MIADPEMGPTERDYEAEFEAWLIGRSCTIIRREHGWTIDLGDGATITIAVPWRIVSQGRIAFADRDDGHSFGLPAPLDGEVETRRLLTGKRIVSAKVDRQTADIALLFDSETRLDVFNSSSGYEGWEARCKVELGWIWLIAQGGGNIVVFTDDAVN